MKHPADYKQLLQRAISAASASYAPYSNRNRGAALLTADGTVFTGCSVEFATFSGSVCAETNAIAKAVSEGQRSFKVIAIFPDMPCGACRQFLREFSGDVLIVTQRGNEPHVVPLADALPHSFILD